VHEEYLFGEPTQNGFGAVRVGDRLVEQFEELPLVFAEQVVRLDCRFLLADLAESGLCEGGLAGFSHQQ